MALNDAFRVAHAPGRRFDKQFKYSGPQPTIKSRRRKRRFPRPKF